MATRLRLEPILPRGAPVTRRAVEAAMQTVLKGFALEFQREIARYPPQRASDYRRTGTYGRGWNAAGSVKPHGFESITVENLVGYAAAVSNSPRFAAYDWPQLKETADVVLRRLQAQGKLKIGLSSSFKL